MPWHSTHEREELLIVVQGGVIAEVRRGRVQRLALRAGDTLFLPRRTEHQVHNPGRRPAGYVYITG